MKKTKIMTIVGTRPEIIKLSRVISQLEKFSNHILVHTGQNFDYELNEIFFKDLDIKKPDYFLDCVGSSTSETIGNIIAKSDKVLEEENPDAVLLYGDTNSCLSVISAKRRQIPIFHMEAGNRCFDERVPEEINRKIVDHLSDINLPLTDHARKYLIREGLDPSKIFKIGSCMKEILNFYSDKINSSEILKNLKLKSKQFFLVSIHREENVDYYDNLISFIESLNEVVKIYDKQIIISTHPRTRNRLKDIENKLNINKKIKFIKPVGFFDYINLQKKSICVISDSGTISEESSILKFPAIMIRKAHERPEAMDEGTVIMSGLQKNRIIESINITLESFKSGYIPNTVFDYDIDNVSVKVVKIIFSYIDYINSNTWKKDSIKKSVQN
ncbi:UDP-N-acetylglucosamine 2-epimerase (non-hydrolyzing) [Flavobacteriaceae bacterium]|nr:UDP-N-acetylglucosamine 2-epimerase (non-hydrolyzing) [Flavobacteriaceae bacterium]